MTICASNWSNHSNKWPHLSLTCPMSTRACGLPAFHSTHIHTYASTRHHSPFAMYRSGSTRCARMTCHRELVFRNVLTSTYFSMVKLATVTLSPGDSYGNAWLHFGRPLANILFWITFSMRARFLYATRRALKKILPSVRISISSTTTLAQLLMFSIFESCLRFSFISLRFFSPYISSGRKCVLVRFGARAKGLRPQANLSVHQHCRS